MGLEAIYKPYAVTLAYPVQGGVIENFEQMTDMWYSTLYNELRSAPEGN